MTIGAPEASRSGIVWTIYFDPGKRNWDKCKRLIYGSLLLISSDNFNTNAHFMVATVADSDKRKDGEISVRIERGNINPRLEYTMLESSAFFEPYKEWILFAGT